MKGKTDSNTIIVGDFNTPVTSMDRSSREKINKETLALSDTLDQMNLTDISSLNKVKMESIASILSNHSGMRVEIYYMEKTAKNTNTHVEAKQYASQQTMGH